MGDSGVCVLTEEATSMAKKKKAKKKAKVKAKRKAMVGCGRTFTSGKPTTAATFTTKSCTGD